MLIHFLALPIQLPMVKLKRIKHPGQRALFTKAQSVLMSYAPLLTFSDTNAITVKTGSGTFSIYVQRPLSPV